LSGGDPAGSARSEGPGSLPQGKAVSSDPPRGSPTAQLGYRFFFWPAAPPSRLLPGCASRADRRARRGARNPVRAARVQPAWAEMALHAAEAVALGGVPRLAGGC